MIKRGMDYRGVYRTGYTLVAYYKRGWEIEARAPPVPLKRVYGGTAGERILLINGNHILFPEQSGS